MSTLAKDGHGNVLCVLVSPRIRMIHDGQVLYYHVVAYISAGGNHYVEPETGLVEVPGINGAPSTWQLQLKGDDKGVVFDGSKVALENYQLTKDRLTRFARAYESYFKIRYQSRLDKNPNRNYFYANAPAWDTAYNGEPTRGAGDPDTADSGLYTYFDPGITNLVWPTNVARQGALSATMAPATFASPSENDTVAGGANNVARILGMNDNDVLDAWGHLILIDNASGRVRSGVGYAPYTAQFGALLPGAEEACIGLNDPGTQCPLYMTATAASTF